jgi:hypothetical protein
MPLLAVPARAPPAAVTRSRPSPICPCPPSIPLPPTPSFPRRGWAQAWGCGRGRLDAGTDDLAAAGAGGLAAAGGMGALTAAPTGQGDLDATVGGLVADPDDLDAVDTGDLAVQGAAHALTAAYGLPLLLQLLLQQAGRMLWPLPSASLTHSRVKGLPPPPPG